MIDLRLHAKQSLPWFALLFAPALLIARCWDAPFLSYDDTDHVANVPQLFEHRPLSELVDLHTCSHLTFVSYGLDYWLACKINPGSREAPNLAANTTWPAVIRVVSGLGHAAAALLIWRLFLLLGAGALPAFFIALVFAVHPTACESVCWVSERKNVLAAMFGFASVFAYARLEGSLWRVPLAVVLFALAALSKPSALGLLPLFPIIELFGGVAAIRGERALNLRPNPAWKRGMLRMLPLGAAGMAALWMHVHGLHDQIIAPPGGSIYTGLLTDSEILVRYFSMLMAPVALSAGYFVKPIVSILDPRFVAFISIVAAIVAASIALARSRRRAVFGWLWFIVALSTNFNIFANYYPMQDRYIYLSMPGFFLAMTEMVLGCAARLKSSATSTTSTTSTSSATSIVRVCGTVFVLALAAVGFERGGIFRNTFLLFYDAAQKQPLSAWAHYGLSQAYLEEWAELGAANPNPNPEVRALRANLRRLGEQERRIFVDKCPDAVRHDLYTPMALQAGEHQVELNNLSEAERYFKLCAFPAAGIRYRLETRAMALRDLALLRLQAGNPSEACALADQALSVGDQADKSLFVRARAAIAWSKKLAESNPDAARELRARAKSDLSAISADSSVHGKAVELLANESFEGASP
jgi:hypothetical protein